LKIRVITYWGMRFDVRWYNSGKPFDLPNQSDRLRELELSGGVTLNL
jgi:hypothetical protein